MTPAMSCDKLAMHACGCITLRAPSFGQRGCANAARGAYVSQRLASMQSPQQVLNFALTTGAASGAPALEESLRVLGRFGPLHLREVAKDARFHVLLESLAARLEECDSKVLAGAADAAARFEARSAELDAFAEELADAMVRRENGFSPEDLASMSLALAVRGVCGHRENEDDLGAAVTFVRGESFRQMQNFDPRSCLILLDAFRRWGIFDRELVDIVFERLVDTVRYVTTRDAVQAFTLMSRLGHAPPGLLRELCQLSFRTLDNFSGQQLAAALLALAKLRFLAQRDVDDLLCGLLPKLGKLSDVQVSQALFALAMVDADRHLDLARVLIVQYADGIGPKTLTSDLDMLWALCALDLVGKYSEAVSEALSRVFKSKPPRPTLELSKFSDALAHLHEAGHESASSVPEVWCEACALAVASEVQHLAMSDLHSELEACFARISRESTHWRLPALRVERDHRVGACRVDFFDEQTRLVVDVEPLGWPITSRVRHRMLRRWGYRPLRLSWWDLKEAKSREDRVSYLAHQVGKALAA